MDTQCKICIIVNPFSRHHKKHPEHASKYESLGKGSVEVKKPSTVEELTLVAKDIKNRAVPYIGISGGDGTIHQVVSAFIREYYPDPLPPVLLLGDGTMNNIAHSIGLSSGGLSVLSEFLKSTATDSIMIQKRTTIQINDMHCFLFGCGMVSNFLNEAYRGGKKGFIRNMAVIFLSMAEALKTVFVKDRSTLKIMRPLEADIYVQGKKLPISSINGILAGTVEKIGMGLRPLSKARKSVGHFHLIATETPPVEILFNMIPIGAGIGLPLGDKRYFDMVASEFEIRSRGPFDYTMDGDMYTADSSLMVRAGVEIRFITM